MTQDNSKANLFGALAGCGCGCPTLIIVSAAVIFGMWALYEADLIEIAAEGAIPTGIVCGILSGLITTGAGFAIVRYIIRRNATSNDAS